eukprot:gene1341-782_t
MSTAFISLSYELHLSFYRHPLTDSLATLSIVTSRYVCTGLCTQLVILKAEWTPYHILLMALCPAGDIDLLKPPLHPTRMGTVYIYGCYLQHLLFLLPTLLLETRQSLMEYDGKAILPADIRIFFLSLSLSICSSCSSPRVWASLEIERMQDNTKIFEGMRPLGLRSAESDAYDIPTHQRNLVILESGKHLTGQGRIHGMNDAQTQSKSHE